jgi:hypothetical protein
MGQLLAAVALAGFLAALPPAALAQGDPPTTPEAEAMAGVERLLRALELFIQSIPQFEAPVMNENGDIIIRRKRPESDQQPPPAPEATDSTRT